MGENVPKGKQIVFPMGNYQYHDRDGKCRFCHRDAETYCDFPTSHVAAFDMDGPGTISEYTNTCDAPICRKCAIDMGLDVHICPSCMRKIMMKGHMKGL